MIPLLNNLLTVGRFVKNIFFRKASTSKEKSGPRKRVIAASLVIVFTLFSIPLDVGIATQLICSYDNMCDTVAVTDSDAITTLIDRVAESEIDVEGVK